MRKKQEWEELKERVRRLEERSLKQAGIILGKLELTKNEKRAMYGLKPMPEGDAVSATREKDILYEQLELLADRSKRSLNTELPALTEQMVNICGCLMKEETKGRKIIEGLP